MIEVMILLDTILFPLWWWQVIAFGFGVIIGSFLNVYIYRFHTGKSLSGHSHCLSCGGRLRWFELFPLFSYLVLKGRCRQCGCKIPSRYFLVELATGILFSLTIILTLDVALIAVWWFIFSVLVVITVYDLYHFIIPDFLTGVLTGAVVLMGAYKYFSGTLSTEILIGQVATAVGGASFFFLLWLLSQGRWLGFGDVKLAFPLGLLVGPAYVFSFIVLAFWIGAIISLSLIAWAKVSRGKERLHLSGKALTMKSAVPFAPFLVASSLVIIFTHFNVLELFSFA